MGVNLDGDTRASHPVAAGTVWDRFVREVPEFRTLTDSIRKQHAVTFLHGLVAGAPAFVLSALLRSLSRPACWVVPEPRRADRLRTELEVWWPGIRVDVLPPPDLMAYEVVAERDVVARKRLQALGRWVSGSLDLLIIPAAALPYRLPPLHVIREQSRELEPGCSCPPQELIASLVALGYRRTHAVREPGQFAVRGGLLDVFPPTETDPVRMEWFDDEIESLRSFDSETQRSHTPRERVFLGPARELVLTETARNLAIEGAAADLERMNAQHPSLAERVRHQLEALDQGIPFAGMEGYLPYAYPQAPTCLGWVGDGTLLILEETHRIEEAVRDRLETHREHVTGALETGRLLPAQAEGVRDLAGVLAEMRRLQRLDLLALPRRSPEVQPQTVVTFQARTVPSFRSQWGLLAEEVQAWTRARRGVLLAVSGSEKAQRLRETLAEHGLELPVDPEGNSPPAPGEGKITVASLPEGFELAEAGLVVLSEPDIAGRPVRPARRPRSRTGVRIHDYTDLREGDYIVHVHHGIGRYLGVQTMEVQGVRKDYLVLQYQGGDRVYVPTEQIDLVQKYAASEGRIPRIHKLGGNEWSRVKERVRHSVRQMAEELLALYSARSKARGHAFSPDGPWQRDFEEAFPFEETEDQLRAIEEIKRDMESERPMDRLLSGDVGYGKTEVAMRAAFKAVADGKQVAVLVPTTILAQQHYLTFRERFRDFPVEIRMLSRFRSLKEQEETITALRRGSCDIVIGTHRLIQGEIGFRDLGLLIIDEEHRFGVAQKERITRLKQNVDVLSMTATPIPRTLHMALSGLRDMSVIDTPPEDRHPVQTYVAEMSDGLVRDVIRRELARGGQVYYVHNRVRSIRHVEHRLRQLIPEASIAVAHGQMEEDSLERIMLRFIEGEFDILLCTTIIESGLDIPNANTLVVEDADQLGLAQLYQLRGRVGRSGRIASAYFLYRRGRSLSETAEKRLQALKDFTDLGSGFQLAMRDLEIRGSGNILGPEQHGFVVSVGLDLYAQLLEEAVRELRGEKESPRLQPTVELGWDAYIPSEYVQDPAVKVDFYKRIERATSRDALASLRDEFVDRFGDIPEPVWNLLLTADIRRRAADVGAISISREGPTIRAVVVAIPLTVLRGAGLDDRRRRRLLQGDDGRAEIVIHVGPNPDRRTLRGTLEALLQDLEKARDAIDGNGRMISALPAKNESKA